MIAVYPCEFDLPHRGLKFLEWYDKHKVFHPAVDLNKGIGDADLGNPVVCPVEGEVFYVSPKPTLLNRQNGGFGLFVVVYHPVQNLWTRYAHLNSVSVVLGQELKVGEQLGKVGKSGTTSSHLHFEVWRPSMYEIQAAKNFRYYPTGQSKQYVTEHYIDPLAWIESLNQQPEYKNELEKWASGHVQNVPLLISGDVHSMLALIRSATKNNP